MALAPTGGFSLYWVQIRHSAALQTPIPAATLGRNMVPTSILVVLLGTIVVLFALTRVVPMFQKKNDPVGLGGRPVYRTQGALLSPAEQQFWHSLREALPDGVALFAKVRLADLVRVGPSAPPRMRAVLFNRIRSKHVGFVLCRETDSRIVGVIELDDASHERGSRKQRDEFIDQTLEMTGISVLRIPSTGSYPAEGLRELIMTHFGSRIEGRGRA